MGIDVSSMPTLNKLNPLRYEQQGCDCQDQDEPFQAGSISQSGILYPKQAAFLVQEAFLDLKAFAVLGERLHARRFVADDLPLPWAVCRTAQGHVDWTKMFASQGDVVETAGLSWRKVDLTYSAEPLPIWGSENQVGFDADAVVPATRP